MTGKTYPLNDRSGIEYLSAMAQGEISPSPMNLLMGFRLIEAEVGRVVFEGTPGTAHMNPMDTTHGGWFGTILDSALGCAVMSRLDRGQAYTTLEYKVNLIRGIAPGTTVHAIATAPHVGRSTGVAHAELRSTDATRLYATASTTCLVMTRT